MTPDSDDSRAADGFELNIDLRPVDTLHAVSALRKYLEVIEEQMPIIQVIEISSLEGQQPPGSNEEEQSIFSGHVSNLEALFEDNLIPTMRYSFIVFLHTVFETNLRSLCNAIRREKNLPISLCDLRGSALDQARDYLTKIAGIAVSDYPEWTDLRTFQKVRDCIVHHYGFLDPNDIRHRRIQELAQNDPDLEINYQRRILPAANFCTRQLAHVDSFFRRLMVDIGWDV